MGDSTPQLQPSELYDRRKTKDASRLKAYNKILEQIYNRIRVISRLPNSHCYLLYSVPPFILGLPKIDLEDCIVYLVYQLRQTGYGVRYTYPNLIYISWEHHEKSYLMEQSPILQAMLESAEKSAKEKERSADFIKKREKKVKFVDGFSRPAATNTGPTRGAINTVLSAGPPPPSASEYIPPSSFLQSMQTPQNLRQNTLKSVPDYFGQ